MEIIIGLFVSAIGVALLVAGYRFYQRVMTRASELSQPQSEMAPEAVEVTGEVHADGLVYLYGHEFAQSKASAPMTLSREKAFAPLTQVELDPQDWATQLLYAPISELHASSCLDYRIVERQPSFLPPFPHKRWELEVIQRTPFGASPVMSAMEVAFELMRARKQQRVAQGKEEPGELWCPLDEIIERALKAMRQEISFWERSGVLGDVRNYVASAMVAQGYLIQPARETWLDRARSKRPKPNVEPIQALRPAVDALNERLAQYRLKHGSPFARGEQEPQEGQQQLVRETDPDLVTREGEFGEMPFDDALRISIYETLVSLKQLEPSGGSGI